jgi:hypothetical protein
MILPIEVSTHSFLGGVKKLYRFDNGYGASVLKNEFSYGGNKGLWELAVLKYTKNGKSKITYDTPITSDVIGHLTDEEVERILDQINQLPKHK